MSAVKYILERRQLGGVPDVALGSVWVGAHSSGLQLILPGS